MRREKNYKTARLIEALEYIDVRFIEEAGAKIKERPTEGVYYATHNRKKTWRQIIALAACIALFIAAVPIATYLSTHLPDFIASIRGEQTTETDPAMTYPETPPEETTVPAPDTTEDTTEIYHETTEEPWPSTTAVPDDTTSPPEETTECTHNEFIATENMPTCTESATVYCSCLACGYGWIEIMPPLGHNYVNNICTRCGAEIEYDGSQGLEYKINDDGKGATFIGMGSCKDTDIVVASFYKGHPVTDIRFDAFAGSWITSVTLSDSVICVDYSVFMNCNKNLKQIHISKSVLEFGHDAFSFLQSLEKITVSPENPRYYVTGNCLIDRETKEVLRGWGDFTIPDDGSVTSIAEGAFSCCNIVNVVVPKGITEIDSSAFAFCASLKRISLPEGLLTIGDGSFDSCTSLESITFPDSLTKIDSGAFAYCENLLSIKIGRRIERIEKEVFYYSAVRDIEYAGTMSEWNSIKKPDNWNYNCYATVVHCSDGDVDLIEYDGSRGLEYRIVGDHAVLVGIGTCTDKEIIVASTYNGLPVTSVDYSFSKISNVTSVTLSDSVLTVGGIYSMPDLVSVYFSKSLEGISPDSLIGCPNLVIIEVDKGNPKYMSSGNCLIEKATKTLVHGCKGSVIPSDGSVSVIGESSFQGCDWLTELTIPEGIERINAYAFGGCESLKRVNLPDSLTYLGFGAFSSCESLETISLGSSLETLSGSVFEDCPKLMELAFPKTTKLLCALAFFECKSLTKVSYEGTMAEWKAIEKTEMWSDGAAFSTVHCTDGDLDLYEYDGSRGLLYVQYGSYAQLAGIGTCTDKNIVIASTYNGVPVVIIEDGVFKNNKNIRSVTIPDKVHYIGKDAFAFCTSLESVVLPKNLKTLGADAFNGCTALASINIPAGITEIDSYAFSGCSSLKEIVIPEGVTVISNEAFYLCKNLKSVTLPSTLEYIQDWAFANCESLESIVIPDAVKWIGQRAFSDCAKLSALTLGEGLEQIQENAFMNCTSLESVSFPRGLKLLAAASFDGCTKLANVSYGGTTNEWSRIGKEGAEWNSEWYRRIPATKVSCSDGDVYLNNLTESDAIEAARKFWGLPSNAVLFAKERSPSHPDCYKIAYCEPSPIDFAVKREVFVDQNTGKCTEVVYNYPNIPEVFLDVIFNRENFLYVEQTRSASGEYTYTASEAFLKDLSIHGDSVLGLQTLWYCVIDIDGDSIPELVFPGSARSNYGILLRAYEGKIYGYACMLDGLHTDATYLWYEQAGKYRGRSQVYFDGIFYKSRTLTERDTNDPNNIIYYVEGKETTKEKYEEFEPAFSNEELESFQLDYYPVYVNPFPGG